MPDITVSVPSRYIEVDISDLVSTLEVEIDEYDAKKIVEQLDEDDVLDQIDNCDIAAHVEGQGASEMANHFSHEFVHELFQCMPEVQQLIVGVELDLSMGASASRWLETGEPAELAAALDLLTANDTARLAIQDALLRYTANQAAKAQEDK
jgi:hypothetical protein